MTKTAVRAENAPPAGGPYSQAIIANGFVYCAGQVGTDPATRKLVEGGVQAQATQALKNLGAVLEAAGSSFDKAVKTSVFLTNLSDFAAMNEVYATFFTQTPPARTTVQVAGLPGGALVEIDIVALV